MKQEVIMIGTIFVVLSALLAAVVGCMIVGPGNRVERSYRLDWG